MAMSMDAVLRVKAAVTGDGAIAKMASGLGGLTSQAEKAQKGLKGMAGAAGGLGGALGALVPALSLSGIGALAMNSVKASAALYDLSIRTGVSVEMLAKYRKAAGQSGTTVDNVASGILKLTKVMAMAAASKGISVPGGKAATDEMEELGLSGKGASQVFADLGIRVTDIKGNLRNAGDVFNELGGKIKAMPDGSEKVAILGKVIKGMGPEFIQMFNKFGDFSKVTAKLTTEQAKAAKDYELKIKETSAAIGGIGASLGMALLPALKSIADGLAWFTKGFTSLPAPIQQVAGTITLLALAFTALAPALAAAGALLAPMIAGIAGIAAAITSLGGIVSVIGMVASSLAALVTWPVLIVAGIVAAVAVLFTFREQIGGFFTWLGDLFVKSMEGLGKLGYTLFIEPFIKMWGMLKAPIVSIFNSITNTVKAALNNIISFFGNIVNGIINVANNAISGFNRVSPIDIQLIGNVNVPRFAQGGFVTGPTLAMIGDNRSGREYAVPEEKAAAFANNFLAGRRGAAAITSSGGSGGGSGGGGNGPLAITVNLTTGPVMEQGGQRYVTIEDAERIARATAAQAVGQLRTPGGRRAAGIR
jgi:hypothetical protein